MNAVVEVELLERNTKLEFDSKLRGKESCNCLDSHAHIVKLYCKACAVASEKIEKIIAVNNFSFI